MDISRKAFAMAFTLGLATVGGFVNAEDPQGPQAQEEVARKELPPGAAVLNGATGPVVNPGAGRIGALEVSAKLEKDEVVIEARKVAEGETPKLEVASMTLFGSEASRMGPMMIDVHREPIDLAFDAGGKASVRVAVARLRDAPKEWPAGRLPGDLQVLVRPARSPATNLQTPDQAGVHVLALPEAEAKPESPVGSAIRGAISAVGSLFAAAESAR